MDGNCMYHVLADQSFLIDHVEARKKTVENILPLVENGTIFWNDEIYISDWIENQMIDGVFGDAYSLQIAANILQRDIIIIPTKRESAHNPLGYILIESSMALNEPIYMLYFEETVYGVGHYQSIKPVGENQILKHYRWVKNKQVSRTVSVSSIGEPIICSSRLSKRAAEDSEDQENPGKRRRLSSSTGDYDTSDALESIIGSTSRKAATGCHICKCIFKKKMSKKRCHCGLYCHKKCFGNCVL